MLVLIVSRYVLCINGHIQLKRQTKVRPDIIILTYDAGKSRRNADNGARKGAELSKLPLFGMFAKVLRCF